MGQGPLGRLARACLALLSLPLCASAAAATGWRVLARDTLSGTAWDVVSLVLNTSDGPLTPSTPGCRAVASSGAPGGAAGAFTPRSPEHFWRGRRGAEGVFYLGLQCEAPRAPRSAAVVELSSGRNFARRLSMQALEGGKWRRLAGAWTRRPSGNGLVSTWRMGLLEVTTCNCDCAGTINRVEFRLPGSNIWQRLAGPFSPGSNFSVTVPAGKKSVEMRVLGDDGWCIESIRLDGRRVVSGLPMWLDLPCENTYNCRSVGAFEYRGMGCSSSYTWSVDSMPADARQIYKGAGCLNWQLILKGNMSVEDSAEVCAARCMLTPLCSGFQFQPFDYCGRASGAAASDLPKNSCVLWQGDCDQTPDGCFDQYALNHSSVRNVDAPITGQYVTYPAGSRVPRTATCSQGATPGWLSWLEDGGSPLQLRLEGRELVGVGEGLESSGSGRVQPDGAVRWHSGALSIPSSLTAKPATRNGSDPVLSIRSCDAPGAGTTTAIQYRLSENEDWTYLGAFFERGQVYSYAVGGVGPYVQIRALGADTWCVSSISLGGVEVREGLPIWLQHLPTHTARRISAEGNVWRVGSSLPSDVKLVASHTGCSNWRSIALKGLFIEASATACASRCRGVAACVGFSFQPYIQCRGGMMWGTCSLRAGPCLEERGLCFDQYSLTRAGPPTDDNRTWGSLGLVLGAVMLSAGATLTLACGWERSRKRLGSCGRISAISSCTDSSSEEGSDSDSSWCRDGRVTTVDSFPKEKVEDPAWAAISMEQLEELYDKAGHEFGSSIARVTMYDVNDRILQPLCARHGKCYAHVVNEDDLLFVDVFVSHAWAETLQEFVDSVRAPFIHWTRKPTLWICATALIQSADTSVVAMQVGVGDDPLEAPFTRALKRAEKMLVVRNSACDLYDRIWCCWELHLALEMGHVHRPGAMMVTGPRRSAGKVVDIASASATNDDDKQKILAYIRSTREGYAKVNQQLTEIRSFGF